MSFCGAQYQLLTGGFQTLQVPVRLDDGGVGEVPRRGQIGLKDVGNVFEGVACDGRNLRHATTGLGERVMVMPRRSWKCRSVSPATSMTSFHFWFRYRFVHWRPVGVVRIRL
jgi:hypothetical protein